MAAIIYTYRIPFDILDAAVDACLSRYGPAPGWVQFERQQKTGGSAEYRLWQEHLGDLGKVIVRKGVDDKTCLETQDPPHPPQRDSTPEELAEIQPITDPEEKRRACGALTAKIWQEGRALYLARLNHQKLVLRDLFFKLDDDPALTGAKVDTDEGGEGKGKPGRPHLTEEDWQERRAMVEKVLQTQERRGCTLEQACTWEGLSYSTFRDWRSRLTNNRDDN